jgi:SAM-dependent methyltransferase
VRRDDFVRAHLPPPPARVLEVGCGGGELARSLAERGYEVTAIDPGAPEGPIFHRVAIEDFLGPGPYDAAVASRSLHHVADLPGAVERIAALLRPDGTLLIAEFARERMHGATAAWYHRQRQALAAVGVAEPVADCCDDWLRAWEGEHGELHTAAAVLEEVARRFDECHLEWTPYLFEHQLDDALEPLERSLLERGLIEATGLHYVGALRRAPGRAT